MRRGSFLLIVVFRDYPQKLTKEQRELFAKENPEWAKFRGVI